MRGSRILAVEDSPTQREALNEHLLAAGFEVVLAASGEEALERFDEGPYSLVVSDIMMPGIDGYELCRRIKELDPSLPVVLLTSLSDPLDVVRGLESGADNFLRKPYDAKQLVSRLQSISHNLELRREGRTHMGLELFFLNRRFMITAERQQILDLLVSTFEDLVGINQKLRKREEELAAAHEAIATQLRAAELEHQRLQAVLAAMPEPTVIFDSDNKVTEASEAWSRFGVAPETLLGRTAEDLGELFEGKRGADQEPRPLGSPVVGQGAPQEVGGAYDVVLRRPDGRRIPVINRTAPVRAASGERAGAVTVVTDIGDLAGHDPTTGLPNHAVFADRVTLLAKQAVYVDEPMAVLVLALDRLQEVREAGGQKAADRLVADVSEQLAAILSDPGVPSAQPFAAYLGGSELAVALPGLPHEAGAVGAAQKLCDELRCAVDIAGTTVTISVSIGLAFASRGRTAASQLVPDAAAAARTAAAKGSCYEVYDPSLHERAEARLRREADLRRAIDEGQLTVHYQPTLLMNGSAVGAEALVRWHHPEDGLVPPADFIPLAEQTGLVAPLGWWVLDEACRQASVWRETLSEASEFNVSVNLSTQQLDQPDATDRIRQALDAAGLPPDGLTLEITEAGVMADAPATIRKLNELKALGVRLAVDDFGTGYSSLVYLRRFPVDSLKIDRSFVAAMMDHAEDAAIVAGTVRLGHALGLHVVAEGVETASQLARLRQLGCDYAQGFHWSQALEPETFEDWWQARPSHGGSADAHRLAEAADEAIEAARDDTLAYLVHELRTPITIVSGYAQMLADHHDRLAPEEIARQMDALQQGAHDLDARLTVLSDARHLESGSLELATRPCVVQALVQMALKDLSREMADRTVQVDGQAESDVLADPSRVKQILTNLISNANKFSPTGAPLEISISSAGERVEISVRDHGPGVPEGREMELFRRFSRLGSTINGMGIGLFMSRALARAQGGDIRHERPDGGGARFVLSLPVAERQGSPSAGVRAEATDRR